MSSIVFDAEIKNKLRIAVVVQRYGKEVNGGAEVHATMIAKRLAAYYTVEVITTCAKDYKDWNCYYDPGMSNENGLTIRRFSCQPRDKVKSKAIMRSIKYSWPVLWRRKVFALSGKWFPYSALKDQEQLGEQWLQTQGPYAPELKNYIAENQDHYDAFIFCTSLYYTAAACLPAVGTKSILVPHLHNETPTFFPIYQRLFDAAQKVICNTQSELHLMQTVYSSTQQKSEVAGVGVDVMSDAEIKLGNDEVLPDLDDIQYILYLGRVSPGKGCKALFEYFSRYIKASCSKVRLIVAGGSDMLIPTHPQIQFLGFVSERVKGYLLANAQLLVIPSQYESLSLVLLESFAYKVPVLVNEKCEVLKEHILHSAGGYMFKDYLSFVQRLQHMLSNDALRARQGIAGYEYVKEHYSWDQFDRQYLSAIQFILKNNGYNDYGDKHELSKTSEC